MESCGDFGYFVGGLPGGLILGLDGAPPELELLLGSLEEADIVVSMDVLVLRNFGAFQIGTEA